MKMRPTVARPAGALGRTLPATLVPSLALALALALAACASSPALRAADRGDLPALRRAIAADHERGRITNDEAADLARAVARHEVETAPPAAAGRRVHELEACAGDLDGLLSDRMELHDDAGAAAALARLDAGNLSASKARRWLGDSSEAWRAVGARGLVRTPDDHDARVKAIVDESPRVRRAAVRAAAEALDARDVDALAEAARLDPELLVRTEAVRALAGIGGAEVVAKLRDLWTNGDDGLREDIARAWAEPKTFDAGGREALRVLLATEHGPGVIEAAAAAASMHARDAEIASSAAAVLARAITDGSRRDRLHAIALAPVDVPDVAEALRKAAKDEPGTDLDLRTAALARLLASSSSPKDHDAAVRALETIAGQEHGRISSRARAALAAAGDLRIQAWIEKDLAVPDASAKLEAASALASLGRSARGAPLLADADPDVRTRVVCTLVSGARRVPR